MDNTLDYAVPAFSFVAVIGADTYAPTLQGRRGGAGSPGERVGIRVRVGAPNDGYTATC